MTEIKENIKGLRVEISEIKDDIKGQVKDLRNLFVSSQKGQSQAANSALSLHRDDGNHHACGTLAYSARLKEAVVITNRHAVVDSDYPEHHCRYNLAVRTSGDIDIPISRWYVLEEDGDIAYGRLAQQPPIPALNITPSADVVPGLHIWASSLQETGLVALDCRVTSTLRQPFQLMTSVDRDGIAH